MVPNRSGQAPHCLGRDATEAHRDLELGDMGRSSLALSGLFFWICVLEALDGLLGFVYLVASFRSHFNRCSPLGLLGDSVSHRFWPTVAALAVYWGSDTPFMSISTLWTSLLLYSLIAGSIWWNHLLGGARRWAVLSGQLAAQLVDQADAATGIAFLTRDWAEMARRSLAALDQVPTDAALLRTNRTIGSVVAIQDISSSLQITVPSNLVGYRRHKAEHAEFMPLKCCWGELRVAHSPRALPLRGRSSVAAGGRAFMSWRQHLMLSISASDAFPRPFQRPFEVKAGRPPTRA